MFKALSMLACAAAMAEALPDAVHPKLAAFLRRAETEPAKLAKELRESPVAVIASEVNVPPFNHEGAKANPLPIVVAHGMGDSCFNAGMKSITKAAGNNVGSYSVCVPTGDNDITDTINGFLLNMDKSVDVFAKKIRADPKLAGGFNAFGLSQGNNLINGYIRKYNDPPVNTFMSICGINAGVGSFPQCGPDVPIVGSICELLDNVLGDIAYIKSVQELLFQANYYRDPLKVNTTQYLENSQLSAWNNEGCNQEVGVCNATYKSNFLKTEHYVWVKGTEDTVVWPREAEWWGAPAPGQYKIINKMNDTRWYKEDTFGLQSAEKAGKNSFESFAGEHIRFTEPELFGWLQKYFK